MSSDSNCSVFHILFSTVRLILNNLRDKIQTRHGTKPLRPAPSPGDDDFNDDVSDLTPSGLS